MLTKEEKRVAKIEAFDAYAPKTATTAGKCCHSKTCCAGKSKLRFQYGKRKNGQWYWHIRAKNGEIIAQGEGYKRERSVARIYVLLSDEAKGMAVSQIY